jgi:hypothetical protein
MPEQWFATLAGEVIGPLTPAQLHVFVERGWVVADTPVRHERMRRFVPASEVVGLLPPAGMAPPPLRRNDWSEIVTVLLLGLAVLALLALAFASGRFTARAW